ncbi:uncharacterized protein CTRU02_200254 [Colletotrichum truncatum]|uniref:Uncharacterized protein n=1 Tax=Colletotrichum truncatum TaxID=5467 RepID=A0ACC3ZE08_COLTU|nr:uncharacterized protein CTRU02_00008 [Colletotrichum truncatum]KAF6801259.1 hypothetical protein CTRU02_00008 [Colletotrichum truncatum]
MRFSTSLVTLLLTVTAHASVAQPNELAAVAERSDDNDLIVPLVEQRDEPTLDKRACTYNGCKCNSRGRQLTVCGNCVWSDTRNYVVTSKRDPKKIYECSKTGRCCVYGGASDCGTGSARCIVN